MNLVELSFVIMYMEKINYMINFLISLILGYQSILIK